MDPIAPNLLYVCNGGLIDSDVGCFLQFTDLVYLSRALSLVGSTIISVLATSSSVAHSYTSSAL